MHRGQKWHPQMPDLPIRDCLAPPLWTEGGPFLQRMATGHREPIAEVAVSLLREALHDAWLPGRLRLIWPSLFSSIDVTCNIMRAISIAFSGYVFVRSRHASRKCLLVTVPLVREV